MVDNGLISTIKTTNVLDMKMVWGGGGGEKGEREGEGEGSN